MCVTILQSTLYGIEVFVNVVKELHLVKILR